MPLYRPAHRAVVGRTPAPASIHTVALPEIWRMKPKSAFLRHVAPLCSAFRACDRKVRAAVAANILCGIAGVALMLLTVRATRSIVAAACNGHRAQMATLGVMFCAFLLSRLLVTRLGQWIEAWSITRNSNMVRSRLFNRITNGSFNAEGELHSAEVVSRLTTDVGIMSSALCSTVPAIAISAVSLIGAFAYLFSLAPGLAVIVTALMPIVIAAGKIPLKKTHRLTREIREAETTVNRTLQDDVSQRILLMTLGYSKNAATDFSNRQTEFYRLTIRRNNLSILAGGAVSFGFMAGYAVMFLYCAYGLMDGHVSFATMTALLQLTAMVQQPIVSLSQKITPIVKASVSAERIRELHHYYTPPAPVDKDQADTESTDILIDHVWYRYGLDRDYVFRDLCGTIPAGKLTAVMGETGIGKTTLLRMILGLCVPEKGRVVSPFISAEYDNIVYVPQGNTLLYGTILSNLLMGNPEADEKQIREALHIACADFVEQLPDGLLTRCGENGYGFSQGQAQRICIARGLLRLNALRQKEASPLLLLMDEPTSALDADTEAEMLHRLLPFAKDTTIVAVTHRPLLQSHADTLLSL